MCYHEQETYKTTAVYRKGVKNRSTQQYAHPPVDRHRL